MTGKLPSLQPGADVRCSNVVMMSRASIAGGRLWMGDMTRAIKASREVAVGVNGRMIRIDKMDSYFSNTRLIRACVSMVTKFVEVSMRKLCWVKA